MTSEQSKAKIENIRRREEHRVSDKPMEEYQKSELELEEERYEAKREEESKEKRSLIGL